MSGEGDNKKETGFIAGLLEGGKVVVDAGIDLGSDALDIVQDSFSGAFGAATEKAQTDRENLHKNKYNGFFSSGFETMRHPENLFSQNQKNGIVFYIQVRKNSVSAATDVVGTADAVASIQSNGGFIRGPQTEQDTEINRTSADIDAIGRIGTGTGAVSGLAAGLGFFNGNGKSTFGKFINKGTKVAGAVSRNEHSSRNSIFTKSNSITYTASSSYTISSRLESRGIRISRSTSW